jgi:hypothetical protein
VSANIFLGLDFHITALVFFRIRATGFLYPLKAFETARLVMEPQECRFDEEKRLLQKHIFAESKNGRKIGIRLDVELY